MRIFALSDVHIDYEENRLWIEDLSNEDYRQDILILAGDLTDQTELLENCFKSLSRKFYRVLFVAGNHDLWVMRDNIDSSIEKFHLINQIAEQQGIMLDLFEHQDVLIVPFLSWYDYSFGQPCDKLKMLWMDFRHCKWPNEMGDKQVTDYFLQQNLPKINRAGKSHASKIISFSHFLPRIDLMPFYIPQMYHYLFPVMGCSGLDKQIRLIKPDIHVYGHSHLNRQVDIDGIRYVNNAFAYPNESNIALKQLLCIYEN